LQIHAQSRDAVFSFTRSLMLPGMFERVRVYGASDATHQLLFWSPGSHRLALARIDSTTGALSSRLLVAPGSIHDVLMGDLNGDRVEDLVLVDRANKRLTVITDLSADTLKPFTTVELAVEPSLVVLGDVTNNRRLDLLIADRNTPGIFPFLGNGRGGFTPASPIAPDLAVGAMVLVHLNNDLLLDLVAYDWLTQELHVLYGVGRGRFIDLTTIRLQGDVEKLVATRLSPHRFLDLLLVYGDPPQMQLWHSEEGGSFEKVWDHALSAAAIQVDVSDMDGDGWQDIVVLLRNGAVHVALHAIGASDWIEYGAGRNPTDLLILDVDGNGWQDVLTLHRNERRVNVLYNSRVEMPLSDATEYVTGMRPAGVWVGDVTGNGWADILVVNEHSHSLTVYTGRGEGRLAAHAPIPLAAGPRTIAQHSATDSTMNFIVSYPATRSISYLTLHRSDLTAVNTIIPDVGEMEFLHGSRAQGGAEFFCFNAFTGARLPALAFYQQIGETEFIERNFSLTIPNALLGAAVNDLNNDGIVDVIYAYRNTVSGQNELAVSLGDSALSFTERVVSLTLPPGPLRAAYLWLADFDRDGILDLLISFPRTLKLLRVAKGLGEGRFSPPATIEEGIALTSRSQLHIMDVDGDGVLDIVVNHADRNVLGWLRGIGDGTFDEWKAIVPMTRDGYFALGDMNGDGITDIAVTIPETARLRVYDGTMLFGRGANGR
jgi:hypothetical protein